MIFCRCNFFSKALENHVDVDVLLPSTPDNDCLGADYDEIYPAGCSHPVLFLLHGALDDHTCWVRNTNVERYAGARGMAVVMPSGQNSFYTDALHGMAYYTFITEELPRFVRSVFPVSGKREETFIAGSSMGGYGAAKCGLGRPDLFGGFAAISGAVDPPVLEPRMQAMGFDFFRYDLIFGGTKNIPGSRHDLYRLAADLAGQAVKPRAFIACGLEDTANYDMNCRLRDTLQDAGVPVHFEDGHGGHDWAYWDTCIQHVMEWL